jgi:hypothetical protein
MAVPDMTGSDPRHVPQGRVVAIFARLNKPLTGRFGHDGV